MGNRFLILLILFSTLIHSQLVRDFRINDDTTNTQQFDALIRAAENGNFIIMWSDRRTGEYNSRDYFQRYNSSGKPIGRNVMLQTNRVPYSHAFTVRKDGSFVYAWTDTTKCYMRIYDSTGNASSNTIIASDTNKFTRFLGSQNSVFLTSDRNGNIMISMSYRILGRDTNYLYIQRFNKYGNKIDSNIRVNNITANGTAPDHTSLTTREDGSFIVTWQGNIEIYGFDIFMQMFDSNGHKIGQNRKVNDDTLIDNFQYNPSVSSDSAGSFIIVWEDPRITAGSIMSIWAQAYNPDGSLNGANFLVDYGNIGINDNRAKVSKRRDGKYIIGWAFNPYAEWWKRPQCQRYDVLNQKIGDIINIPRTAPDTAKYFDDILLIGDKIITVWEDTRSGEETRDIYCNILSFINPDSTVGINKISNSVPEEFKLYQNYPNPFNPFTKIDFSISKEGYTRIVIYDILGREVKILVNELKTAGYYTIEFDGSNFSSGIYFYKIQSGNFVDVKRMVLIK